MQSAQLPLLVRGVLQRRGQRLAAIGELLEAVSPEATLRRGYSIVRLDGVAVTDPASIPAGATVDVVFAKGSAQLKRPR